MRHAPWSPLIAAAALAMTAAAFAQQPPEKGEERKSDFPPFDQVAKDYEKVVSTADGQASLYTLYVNRKQSKMLAELPPRFDNQRIFIATSIAGGSKQTGWQWQDMYCYWKQIDKQLVLMQPNLQMQARGGKEDAELRSAVDRTYTDRVITSAKILCMGPGHGPVIDLDDLLVNNSQVFTGMRGNTSLATLGAIRAFPQNLEIPITIPMGGGELTTLHYSISAIPKTEYKPREADDRIGYFMTVYKDFAKNEPGGNQFARYVNRWNLQKRDPNLALSPPTEPIVFYIEHTVPVRYRRWVRDGILAWNAAFEKVGIINAMEVRQQDAQTGAFMDINPEDVRYNFFRWISSERAFAMGPSRVNPETGQILDADIIFDDAMLKNYALQYNSMIAAYGLDGLDPKAVEWMQERPLWNPITQFTPPDPARDEIRNDTTLTTDEKAMLLGEPELVTQSRLLSRVVQQNLNCECGLGAAIQMHVSQLAMRLMDDSLLADADKTPMIDGVPEEYLGTILRYITSHEVGHTLGLRHNFKASSWMTVADYVAHKGEQNVGSVMDYVPIYVPPTPGAARGDWMPGKLGPYDFWAIEYGYTFDDTRRKEMAKESARPEFQFATDEDADGPDPLVARWDLGSEPLDWAKARIELVQTLRGRLLEKAVKDGESWHLFRSAYEWTLGEQLNAIRTASRYVGGVQVNRDRPGSPDARDPQQPVSAERQRTALAFVVANSMPDGAYDLRPEVLNKLATDKFRHWGNLGSPDEAFSVHERVAQIQAFALLYLLNPGVLDRVYDNELRTPADQDALTLPELFNTVVGARFAELDVQLNGATYSNRKPLISSPRRDLQSSLIDRLVDLTTNPSARMPRPIQTLAAQYLRVLDGKVDGILAKSSQVDDYSRAHLADLKERIDQALKAIKLAQSPR